MRTRGWSMRAARALLLFGLTLLLLVAGGTIGMRYVRGLAFARQVTPFVRYPDSSWFLVFYRGRSQLDHDVFWNAIGPSIENARRADVLFLGNSRTQFALPFHELRAFEKRSRVSAFTLGLPFSERYVFALELFVKFDLRPKLVVANVDGFFSPTQSAQATKVIEDGWWVGRTTFWEERIASIVWPIASRIFPAFTTRRPEQYLLRSSTHGAWLPARWPHNHLATKRYERMPDATVLASARQLRTVLALRGTQLVLTCVPSWKPGCSPEYTKAIAAKLGVPAVVPEVHPLWTGDWSHLCPLSGKRYGRALLRELGTLDVVRKIAAARRHEPKTR